MWLYAIRQIAYWTLTVPVLSSVPIAIHLGAVYVNGIEKEMPIAIVADGYLYTFILAMTAVTDSLLKDRRVSIVFYMLFALVTGILYAATLVNAIADRALAGLHVLMIICLIGLALPYASARLIELYGAGKAEWEEALAKGTLVK